MVTLWTHIVCTICSLHAVNMMMDTAVKKNMGECYVKEDENKISLIWIHA